jgi:hypothetical protein
MSTGATDTWSQSRDEIISDALANVGAIGPGETASGAPRDHAARALNRVVKALDAEGTFLWRQSRLTFTTTAGTATYTLSATVFDVDAPVSYLEAGGTTRTPVHPMTLDDYRYKPDRTTQASIPTNYVIEKTLSGAGRTLLAMTLYPVPDSTGDTVEYTAAIRAKDYVTGADTSDFPANWIQALVYGLSAEIAPAYNQAGLAGQFRQMFLEEKERQLGADNEHQGLTLVPFGGW